MDPCIRDRRKECLDFLVSRVRDSANIPDPVGTVRRKGRDLSDKKLVNVVPNLAVPPCSDCFNAYLQEKEQLNQAMKHLSSCSEGVIGAYSPVFLSQFPDDAVISTLIEPLSHENRFVMLKALATGSMIFSSLGELTGSKGGHLFSHLGKLIDAGLVIKDEAGKRYSITDRGLGVMNLIKTLYAR